MTTGTRLRDLLLLWTCLAAVACGGGGTGGPNDPEAAPNGYPAVPRPSGPNDFDQPDVSEKVILISPIEGKNVDFVPAWSQGTFTWDIWIQTVYEQFTLNGWEDWADPPGHYYSGTASSSDLLFEGGLVDLRSPDPKDPGARRGWAGLPRRLVLVEMGTAVAEPYTSLVPQIECAVGFAQRGSNLSYPLVRYPQCAFLGVWSRDIESGFAQRNKRVDYLIHATNAPLLTNRVFVRRERFWERVLVDGAKNVRVDPGFSKSVSFTRTHGTSTSESETFARSLDAELTLGSQAPIGASLKGTLSETFSTTREVTEETSETVTHQVTGLDGKTVIFSVWRSVERYTIVDELGNPYTDPAYTFADLGSAEVRGDHEVLQSAIFAYQ